MNIHGTGAPAAAPAGVPVPPGSGHTAEEAERIAAGFVDGRDQAQACWGRGKAGGVKLASRRLRQQGRCDPGHHQGLAATRVLAAPAEIASESYVGVIVDRASKRPVFMVSREGGVDIEEVAARTPGAIRRLSVDPRYGLLSVQAYQLASALYDDIKQQRACARILQQLYAAFIAAGASLAEKSAGDHGGRRCQGARCQIQHR
jgi:succinyl-CoA synthetase beta subunit